MRQSREPVLGTLSLGRWTSTSAVRSAGSGTEPGSSRAPSRRSQVAGAGAYGARRDQPRHPQCGPGAAVPVPGDLGGVGIAVGPGQPERTGDAVGQQGGVVAPGAARRPGEDMAQQATAEVGVQHPGAGAVTQPCAAQRGEQVVLVEAGVGVAEPAAPGRPGQQSRGQPGQAGGVGRQVEKGERGPGEPERQVAVRAVAVPDLAPCGQLGEQQGGERLRQGARLEPAVLAGRTAAEHHALGTPHRGDGRRRTSGGGQERPEPTGQRCGGHPGPAARASATDPATAATTTVC